MADDAGYLYILTNPAMPGLLKLGKSTRHPATRVAELSRATGVPAPFELVDFLPFEQCSVAERLAHHLLQEQGVRVSDDREFFTLAVEPARALLRELQEKLNNPGDNEAIGDTFLSRGLNLQEQAQGELSMLESAFAELECAAKLGHPQGAYWAGTLAQELSRRKRTPATQHYYAHSAQLHLKQAAHLGVLRAYLALAQQALTTHQVSLALYYWSTYLDRLAEEPEVPEFELQVLLQFLKQSQLLQENAEFRLGESHPFLRHRILTLRQIAKREGLTASEIRSLTEVAHPPLAFLIYHGRWPALILIAVILGFILRPELIILASFFGLAALGFGKGAYTWRVRRKERKAQRQASRKKR